MNDKRQKNQLQMALAFNGEGVVWQWRVGEASPYADFGKKKCLGVRF